MDLLQEEIWKPIKYKGIDYTGRYEISNYGRIKSLSKNSSTKIRKDTISKNGYCETYLPKSDGTYYYTTVHRLVLMMFNPIPNMDDLEVNHIDECKTNNRLDNLEWCTSQENCNHGNRNQKISNKVSHRILCIETKQIYRSQKEACKSLGCTEDGFSNHINGKQSHVHGNHYVRTSKYISDSQELSEDMINFIINSELKIIKNRPERVRSKVKCLETGEIFPSQVAAAQFAGTSQPTISEVLHGKLKTAGGYHWIRV